MKHLAVTIVLVLSVFISGCMGAFVAGAAAGGLVVYDRRPLEVIYEDHNIRDQIMDKFRADRDLSYCRLNVASFNKVVVIIGQAPFGHLRQKAEKIARSITDVKKLYNLIEIKHPISLSQQAEDTWISTKVRTRLLAAPGVKSGMISVATENQIVYLIGKVTKKQADIAVEEVRRVAGVRQVIKIFDYSL